MGFTLNKDGTGSIDTNGYDYLAQDQHLEVPITLSVSDGHGGVATQVFDVTIIGTNDAAVISGTDTASLVESDVIQTVTGQLLVTDVDNSATFNAMTAVEGSNGYGKFTINSEGSWSYTMDSAHNEFVGGQHYIDSTVVTTADGTQNTISVDILGTDEVAQPGHTQVHIRALVDGHDQLIVDDGKLRWEHFDNVVVGWWNGNSYVNEPTYVNVTNGVSTYSVDWTPQWRIFLSPDPLRSHGISSALDLTQFGDFTKDSTVTMTVTNARDSVSLVGLPTQANGWQARVDFNDNPSGASDWYDITLDFSQSQSKFVPVATGEYAGHRYEVYSDRMTWTEAQAYAHDHGGYLVSVTSDAENNYVANLRPDLIETWIGLHQLDNAAEPRGGWV
jgi:VCBS repeat-containing protein